MVRQMQGMSDTQLQMMARAAGVVQRGAAVARAAGDIVRGRALLLLGLSVLLLALLLRYVGWM
jgi:hypothetical protein